MEDWKVGEKVVCINTSAIPPNAMPPLEVSRCLKVGNIYEIAEVGIYKYDIGERVAFKLKNIECVNRITYGYTDKGSVGFKMLGEYMFWSGRFRPLDEMEKLEEMTKEIDKWIDPVPENELEEERFKKRKPQKKIKKPERVLEPLRDSFIIWRVY